MTEIIYCSEGVDKPVAELQGGITSETSLEFMESTHTIVKGNVSIGTALAPITDDEPLITVGRDSVVIIDGALEIYRDVEATAPMVYLDSSAKLIVTGGCDIVRDGIGAGGVFLLAVDCLLKIIGTTDLLSFEGVPIADGSFIYAYRDSKVWLDQVLFNSGGDLAMGAFATVWMDRHSRLHVVDVTGASDALNTSNPGAPACTGVALTGGSQAFLPPWAANSGIGAAAAAANGRDTKVGGAAVALWGGSEILTDLGAGAPEICQAYKP